MPFPGASFGLSSPSASSSAKASEQDPQKDQDALVKLGAAFAEQMEERRDAAIKRQQEVAKARKATMEADRIEAEAAAAGIDVTSRNAEVQGPPDPGVRAALAEYGTQRIRENPLAVRAQAITALGPSPAIHDLAGLARTDIEEALTQLRAHRASRGERSASIANVGLFSAVLGGLGNLVGLPFGEDLGTQIFGRNIGERRFRGTVDALARTLGPEVDLLREVQKAQQQVARGFDMLSRDQQEFNREDAERKRKLEAIHPVTKATANSTRDQFYNEMADGYGDAGTLADNGTLDHLLLLTASLRGASNSKERELIQKQITDVFKQIEQDPRFAGKQIVEQLRAAREDLAGKVKSNVIEPWVGKDEMAAAQEGPDKFFRAFDSAIPFLAAAENRAKETVKLEREIRAKEQERRRKEIEAQMRPFSIGDLDAPLPPRSEFERTLPKSGPARELLQSLRKIAEDRRKNRVSK